MGVLGGTGNSKKTKPLSQFFVPPKLEPSKLEFSGLAQPLAVQDQYERHLVGKTGNIVDEVDVERLTSRLAEGIRKPPFCKSPIAQSNAEKLDKLNYVLQ